MGPVEEASNCTIRGLGKPDPLPPSARGTGGGCGLGPRPQLRHRFPVRPAPALAPAAAAADADAAPDAALAPTRAPPWHSSPPLCRVPAAMTSVPQPQPTASAGPPSVAAPTEGAPLPEQATAFHETGASSRPSRVATVLNFVFLGLGLALFVGLLVRLDIVAIAARMRQVGAAFVFMLGVYVLGILASAAGWQNMVDPQRSTARFRDFLGAYWAGLAINALTPGAQLGGVLRVTLLRGKVETDEAIASVVMFAFFMWGTGLAFNLVAPLLCLGLVTLPTRVVLAVLGIGIAFLIPMLGAYLFLRRGAVGTTLRVLQKLPFVNVRDPAALAKRAHSIDTRMSELRARRPRLFVQAVLWITVVRVLQAVEYLCLLVVLLPERPFLWLLGVALLTQTASQLIVWAMTFVPSQMGVAEANTTLLFRLLGLDPVIGLTLEIGRRMRTIFGILVGLLIGWLLGLRGLRGSMSGATDPAKSP